MNITKHCNEIEDKGFTIIKDFFDKNQLNKVKKSLLEMLNYI